MTIFVIATTVAFLIIYDIIIAVTKGGSETISWQGWMVSQRYPIIPLALGVVIGHMFWVQNCHC